MTRRRLSSWILERAKQRRSKRPLDERSERFLTYYRGLPPEQGGALMLVLWLNAVLTLTLSGTWLLALVLTLVRARRAWRRDGTRAGVTTLPSRMLTAATAASCWHLLTARVGTLVLAILTQRAGPPAKPVAGSPITP